MRADLTFIKKMKIGKLELAQERLVVLISAGIAIIALAVYLIFYLPLSRQLRTKFLECRSVEADALETRNIIEKAGKVYGGRVLMTEDEVHHAIDELTKHGRLKGISFISMSPKKVKKQKGSQYKIMPVEMEIESTYEELGVLLGSLDDLEKGLVKVKKLEVIPDKNDRNKFLTDLVVDIYISGRK